MGEINKYVKVGGVAGRTVLYASPQIPTAFILVSAPLFTYGNAQSQFARLLLFTPSPHSPSFSLFFLYVILSLKKTNLNW